jgi:F0F1-type ATP synthase delta subunit
MSTKKTPGEAFAQGLLDVLHEKKQDDLLPDVSDVIVQKAKRKNKENKAIVWSAIPMRTPVLKRFAGVIGKYTGKKPEVANRINDKLLGGFKIEFDDWVLDASLKRDFYNLEKLLT